MSIHRRLRSPVSPGLDDVCISLGLIHNGEIVNYADLTIIDLGEFDKPGGKEKLAAQLKDAAHNVGR